MKLTSIIILWWLNFSLAFDVQSFTTPKVTTDYSAICVPVQNTNGNAFVELEIDSMTTLSHKKNGNSDKIPTMIIHLTEMLKLDNFPMMSSFNRLSSEEKFAMTNGESFNIDESKLNPDDFKNGYISITDDQSHRMKFDVKNSGYYCIYIAPPVYIEEVDIPIIYHNSYGYLNFNMYVFYKSSILSILVITAVTGYLLHHLLKSTGSDFQNLNGISVISKAVVFYALIPYLVLSILEFLKNLLLNNIARRGVITALFAFSIDICNIALNIFLQYSLLLFCMGYGVLYYHKQTRSYRKIPTSKFKYANILLYIGSGTFILLILNSLFTKQIPPTLVGVGSDDELQVSTSNMFGLFLNSVAGITFFVAYVSSIVYGWKTTKIIKDYPPYSSNVQDHVTKNDELRKAFRRSLLVIFVLPIYVSIVSVIIMGFTSGQPFDVQPGDNPDPKLIPFYINDRIVENSSILYYEVMNNFVLGLIIIVSLYFIWVRRNCGLVIDKEEETGYTDFHDDEEEQVIV